MILLAYQPRINPFFHASRYYFNVLILLMIVMVEFYFIESIGLFLGIFF